MKIRILLSSIFILLLLGSVKSQKIDSLQAALKKANTNQKKTDVLLQLAEQYLKSDASLAKGHALKAYAYATADGETVQKAKAQQIIATSYLYLAEYHKAIDSYKKTLTLYDPMIDPLNVGAVMRELSTAYYQSGHADSARMFALRSVKILKNSSYTSQLIQSLQFLGNLYLDRKQYDSTIIYFEQTLKVYDVYVKTLENSPEMYKKTLLKTASLQGQLGTVFYLSGNFGQAVNGLQKAIAVCIIVEDKDLLASLYIDLGNVYKMQQSADKAIEYYFKALKIYEGKQNLLQVANTYNKIGGIYFDQANYEDAYNNYLIANKMHHKIGNKPGMAATINNLGEVFKMKGMKDSAAFYYSKALNLNNLMGNKSMMGINYQNLGDLFLVNNEFDKALYYFNQAISMFNETNYREALGALNISMGDYFQKQGNYTKSIDHYQKAYALSNELNDKQKKAFSARGLAISFERLGNPQKALAFYKIYSEQKDSLLSIEKHRKLTEIQTKYAYEKQRAEMQLQEEAIKSLEKSKDFNYIIRYLLGAGLLLMIIIGYLLLKRKDVNIKNERLRMDKEHELIQSKQALTEVELRNKSLEKNKLEEDLKYKTHNLMNLAMHISQKNEFLAEIKQCLKETKHLSGHDKELKISDLIIKINQQTRLNKDLKHFQTEIEQTNKEFFLKLKQVCPELTQNEKQLAALLRINLSSKEIASLNNISVKAIEMGRYRLRKKLGIENNENLTNYLQKLV